MIIKAEEGLSKAASVLKAGGVVAFPTETYYGLAALYDNPAGIDKIMELKKRPDGMSLPMTADEISSFSLVAAEIPDEIRKISDYGWFSAFTVVLPAAENIDPRLVTNGTVAIRISSHPVAAALARLVKAPVVSTSANLSGEPPVSTAAEVSVDADLILDGGKTPGGKPSTIAEFKNGTWKVFRDGPVDPFDFGKSRKKNIEGSEKHEIPSCNFWTYQPEKGYRFAIDSVILADFTIKNTKKRNLRLLDLGSGSGVLSFISASSGKFARIDALEINEEYFSMLKAASDEQGLSSLIHPVCGNVKNIKNLLPGDSYDTVICNPPFFRKNTGKSSNEALKDTAMRGVDAELEDFISGAARSLKQGGYLYLILPVERFVEVLKTSEKTGLNAEKVRFIHPFADKNANRFLIALRKDGKTPLSVLPHLCIYDSPSAYSPELSSLLNLGK